MTPHLEKEPLPRSLWPARTFCAAALLGLPAGLSAPAPALAAEDAKPTSEPQKVVTAEETPSRTAKPGADEVDNQVSPALGAKHASNWFTLTGPLFELHGYYRVRSQLFQNFTLGRRDALGVDPLSPGDDGLAGSLWPNAPDSSYVDTRGVAHQVALCGADPTALEACSNDTQAGANMRLRLRPSIAISDNLKLISEIDMLDNIVLGSTPQGYANAPTDDGGYSVVGRGGYSPTGAFASTQWTPISGSTSTKDSAVVKRLWGEYNSPVGKLSFGRMPHHWGLGMLMNGGHDVDSDYQTTVDRIMIATTFKDLDLHVAAAWDFPNEGVTGTTEQSFGQTGADPSTVGSGVYGQGGQAYDFATKDDVDQWVLMVSHQIDPQLARRRIVKGAPVLSTGAYFAYRAQELAQDTTVNQTDASIGQTSQDIGEGLARRGYEAVVSDLWFQVLYRKLRLELEAAFIYGSLENTLPAESDFENVRDSQNNGWHIQQFGLASQLEYHAVEDRLRLEFGFGYASGDPDVANLTPTMSAQSGSSIDRQLTLDRTDTTFRFHPGYNVDMILFRHILSRVQGAYYFKPSVEYDLMRDPDGQRLGGGTALIWSRASQAVQAPGHKSDLGVELNFKMFYQVSAGLPSTDPNASEVESMGGFYTSVEYGVLLPLDGLGYLPGQVEAYAAAAPAEAPLELSPAHTAKLFVGVMF